MRKSMKKILAFVSSAAIAATMIAVPVMTEAAGADNIVVESGSFTVNDDGVATADVTNNGDTPAIVSIISASYDKSGKLVDVKYVPVTIQAGATKTVQTTALTDTGHEIRAFVWDMTDNKCKPVYIAEDETHSYDVFETFDDITDSWGFTGTGGATVQDGTLKLLLNSSDDDIVTDTKIFDEPITSATKLHVMFDWRPILLEYPIGESRFELQDTNGNVLFGLKEIGKLNGLADLYRSMDGVYTEESRYRVWRNFESGWCSVDMTIDFTRPDGEPSLIIYIRRPDGTSQSFDDVVDESIANLGQLYAYNVSGAAPMEIDNFMIKVIE